MSHKSDHRVTTYLPQAEYDRLARAAELSSTSMAAEARKRLKDSFLVTKGRYQKLDARTLIEETRDAHVFHPDPECVTPDPTFPDPMPAAPADVRDQWPPKGMEKASRFCTSDGPQAFFHYPATKERQALYAKAFWLMLEAGHPDAQGMLKAAQLLAKTPMDADE